MMDLRPFIGNTRITDYSFDLAAQIMSPSIVFSTAQLTSLYNYNMGLCSERTGLYPMSNWQTHRLCLMSAIARRLKNTTMAWQCHNMCVRWITISDCGCCDAASQDYHWRDSCQYKVYGWWALAQAMVYLQPMTKKPYKTYFVAFFRWLDKFKTERHVEFVLSRVPADASKPHYNKVFDPSYANSMIRSFSQLTS